MNCWKGRSPTLPKQAETQTRVTLELCTENVAGVLAAGAAGAHRIELCSALAEGGVTPSWGLFQQAKARSRLPIHVLVRPRAGDFCYSDLELAVMLEDATQFREAGAAGLVFGTLTPDGALDLLAMKRLMAAADPLPVTFHRAFDVCREPFKVLEQLVALGVTRLLTSGQQPDALAGLSRLAALNEQAAERIVIIAGGGVRVSNAAQIVRETGVSELHFSAQQPAQLSFLPFAFGSPAFTDAAAVEALARRV